jgi:DNA-binding NarL/FixJ family response regulator
MYPDPAFAVPSPASPMIKSVLLVDDHRMFHQALRLLLEHQLGLTVTATAESGADALAHVERTAFDLILMDVLLPDTNGIDVSRRILELRPDARIIVLSSDADPLRIDEALLAGVMGYVLKINATDELRRALASVAAGHRYLSPEANAALLAGYRRLRETPATTPPLSPREREVVRLIATGQRTKEIAATLGIGVKSAETYRRRVMQKLGLFSVAELTRYALREGLASA